MDYLKEGIGLRAMAQRDPLVEYQREGFDMFSGMLEGLKEESVGFLFNVAVEAVPAPQVGPVAEPEDLAEFTAAAAAAPAAARESGTALRTKGIDNESPELTYTGPAEDGSAQVQGNGGKTPAGVSGGTRRERREAARRQARHSKPKSAKRR
jgi:preprotein translocase subunit SecA